MAVGTSSQWLDPLASASAFAMSFAYMVETATPENYAPTETPPGASSEAVFEETSPGVYTLTDSPGSGARARLVVVDGTARLIEVI